MESPVFSSDTNLLDKQEFIPDGFQFGIEILNDNFTPMIFVVKVFQEQLGMDEESAIEHMIKIHKKGGILISYNSLEEAVEKVELIKCESKELDNEFRIRAVSA